MSRRQWYLIGGVALTLGGAAAVAMPRIRAPDPVAVGFKAPEFLARKLDDPAQVTRLSDYAGSVVLVNVWATWCYPCRKEMPSLERLYRELGPKGFKVLAVSIDDAGAEGDIRDFVREYGLTFEIAHDATGQIQRTYQLIGVPESFLIDKQGVIRKMAFETDWYSLDNRTLVSRLLAN